MTHLSLRQLLAIVALAIGLAACGTTPPKFQAARQAGPSEAFALGTSPLLQQTNHMTRHLNADKTILYTQPYGGGGVGLGLLLGPIGVAANVAMIESVTKADTEKMFGKLSVDPLQAFQKAAQSRQLALQPASTGMPSRLTPYLYVTKTGESSLSVAAAVIYEAGSGAPAKYLLQMPETYTVDQLASLDPAAQAALAATVDKGFERLVAFFLREGASNAAGAEQAVQFKSSFVTPRFDFELQGAVIEKEDDVTWIRTFGAVYGLQAGSLTVAAAR